MNFGQNPFALSTLHTNSNNFSLNAQNFNSTEVDLLTYEISLEEIPLSSAKSNDIPQTSFETKDCEVLVFVDEAIKNKATEIKTHLPEITVDEIDVYDNHQEIASVHIPSDVKTDAEITFTKLYKSDKIKASEYLIKDLYEKTPLPEIVFGLPRGLFLASLLSLSYLLFGWTLAYKFGNRNR